MLRDLALFQRLARFWRTRGITAKFGAAFAVLLAMFILGGAMNFAAMQVIRDAEADIRVRMDIRQKVFEMDGGLEKARRLYRDFLLAYPEIGFEQAQELYGQPALAATARVISVNEELRGLFASQDFGDALLQRNMDINLYLSMAKRFSSVMVESMALITVLADPVHGLETRLNERMDSLKAALAGEPEMALLLREAELDEKQYRISRQRPFMQAAFNRLWKIRRALGDSPASRVRKLEVLALLDGYESLAAKILDVDVDMRSYSNDMALQARVVDPVSQELKRFSMEDVERIRAHIGWVSSAAGGVILVVTLLGVFCAVSVAVVINSSVTAKIVDMTRSAARLRSGSLDVTVPSGSGDELGVLADAFNAMTLRVRGLVENLEENVRQRTLELNRKNRELDEKNQALHVLSLTDRLTGLCNRRKLDQTLRSELRRIRRYHNKPFSVILLDVDLFKSVNDRFGHQMGDCVLVRISDTLLDMARETDTVGRWGGEEFLLICPETEASVAANLAQRLREAIQEIDFPKAGRVTASFGVTACLPGDDEDGEDILRRADMALYRAKLNGRNRIEICI